MVYKHPATVWLRSTDPWASMFSTLRGQAHAPLVITTAISIQLVPVYHTPFATDHVKLQKSGGDSNPYV